MYEEIDLDLATIPAEDPRTYAMIRKADTLGAPLFQEQAMRVAIECAGFTPGEADQLRRAMATFKVTGGVSGFKERLVGGMIERGYDQEFAETTFSQLEGFGSYGFPELHAASFALIAYASSWLKCRHPDVFRAALLNAQPMGFYAPAQIVRDAREHGVEVRPVCVNASRWDCTLACAAASFEQADAKGRTRFCETNEKAHGRTERRRVSVVAAPKEGANMPGLVMFARIESERRKGEGKVETNIYHAALSKRHTPRKLMEIIRTHWDVENRLHWPLDVVFDEDDARTKKDYGPQNLSFIRRMALDILTSHPDKRSPVRKMQLAAWSQEFFFELFTHLR